MWSHAKFFACVYLTISLNPQEINTIIIPNIERRKPRLGDIKPLGRRMAHQGQSWVSVPSVRLPNLCAQASPCPGASLALGLGHENKPSNPAPGEAAWLGKWVLRKERRPGGREWKMEGGREISFYKVNKIQPFLSNSRPQGRS